MKDNPYLLNFLTKRFNLIGFLFVTAVAFEERVGVTEMFLDVLQKSLQSREPPSQGSHLSTKVQLRNGHGGCITLQKTPTPVNTKDSVNCLTLEPIAQTHELIYHILENGFKI